MTQDTRRQRHSRSTGFSVVELLVVFLLVASSLVVVVPPLQRLIHREQTMGLARESKQLIQRTRFEAIKRGVPTVVALDLDTGELVTFADVHGETVDDPSDGLFNPVADGLLRRTDYEIARLALRGGIEWRDPDGNTGTDSLDGWVNTGDPDPPDDQIIFSTTGAASSAGAIRLADATGNFLEIRIQQAGTGKLTLRKWDGDEWLEQGQNGKTWEWK